MPKIPTPEWRQTFRSSDTRRVSVHEHALHLMHYRNRVICYMVEAHGKDLKVAKYTANMGSTLPCVMMLAHDKNSNFFICHVDSTRQTLLCAGIMAHGQPLSTVDINCHFVVCSGFLAYNPQFTEMSILSCISIVAHER